MLSWVQKLFKSTAKKEEERLRQENEEKLTRVLIEQEIVSYSKIFFFTS